MAVIRKVLKIVLLAVVWVTGALCITAHAEVDIAIGEYVQMGSYAGVPIVWRCVSEDDNGALLLSDKVICSKPFDSAGSTGGGSRSRGKDKQNNIRMTFGSNYWGDSNIRCWLNSASAAGGVEWTCQNPPIAENIMAGANGISNEYSDDETSGYPFTGGCSTLLGEKDHWILRSG